MARPKGSKNKGTGKRFKKWEGQFADDKHLRLTKDMMMDERFLALSGNAVRLYLYMKLWASGQDRIEFSASMAKKIMSRPTYTDARDELEKAGFINYTNRHRAKQYKEAAQIEFTDRWAWENKPLAYFKQDSG